MLWVFRRGLNVELIAAAWVLAAAVSATIGLLQYFGLVQALGPWVREANPGEAFANLRQRNHFATLTSIGLVALIAVIALPGRLAQQALVKRVPWWANTTALLLAFGNAASSSRTGLLQWMLILMLIAWWAQPHPHRRYLLAFSLKALLSYLIAVVTLPRLLTALTGFSSGGLLGRLGEAPTCQSRKVLWSNVLTLIAQKPWLGWGWGELAYPHFITPYTGSRFCDILDNAHNLPLHLAVELGIPAGLIICISLGWIVWRAKPWSETDLARQMAWGVLGVIMLHSMLEYPLWYGPFQIAVGLCVGLLWATSKRKPRIGAAMHSGACEKSGRIWSVADIKSVYIAIVLLAALVVVGVDYDRVSDIYLLSPKESIAFHARSGEKIHGLSLFKNQVLFAKLGVTELKPENAAATYTLALGLLHYSPEPRVIEKLVESAMVLGRDDEALFYLARYRAAFPEDHARWVKEHATR